MEIWDNVKSLAAARLGDPILGSFALSWVVCNHRAIFILLSEKPLAWRFEYVDEVVYPTALEAIGMNVVVPLAFSLFYVCVLPIITRPIRSLHLRHLRSNMEANRRSEGMVLLSAKESASIQTEARLATEEAAARLDDVVVKAKEVELRKREIEAFASEQRNAAEAAKNEAKETVANVSAHLSAVKLDLVEKKALLASAVSPAESDGEVETYLRSRSFLLKYRAFDGNVAERVSFSKEGAVVADNPCEYTRWRFERGNLLIQPADSNVGIEFKLMPAKSCFVGRSREATLTGI